MDERAIGVFDSGLGGLTAVRELRKILPGEDIVFFGDTGRVPYGSRSPEVIRKYAAECNEYGMSHVVKIENVLSFAEKSLGKGQELSSSITAMLSSENFVAFIARYGCPKFYELDSELLLGGNDKATELAKKALKDLKR